MPNKTFIKKLDDFNVGMSPGKKLTDISVISHFDTLNGDARPYRALVATDMTHGYSGTMKNIVKFARGASGTIYALGMVNQAAVRPTMAKWDATNKYWDNFQDFGKNSTFAEMMFWYGGNLYGFWRDGNSAPTGYMWKMTPTGTLTAQHAPQNYTNYCDPIFSKATNLEYIGLDNVIYKFDGTTLTSVFAHPVSTFVFTSIAENGIYLNLTGFDSSTLKAESFLWDRNSSVGDVTQKYDLGYDYPINSVVIGGVHFIITSDRPSSNIPDAGTQQSKILTIKYVSGDIVKVLNSYIFEQINSYHEAGTGLSTGEYQDIDKFYFHATVKFLGESNYNRVLFSLDERGKLQIAQNINIDSALSETTFPAVIKERDAFWIGGRGAGTWVTTTTYPANTTESAHIETDYWQSDDYSKSIKLIGYTVQTDKLPSGGSVVVKTRADSEVTWTTLATFDTDNQINCSGTGAALSDAKYRQFRIESLGGAIIYGFQATFEEIDKECYG